MGKRHQIDFSVIHRKHTQFAMRSELCVFFGLHGRTQIHSVGQENTIEESGMCVVSPLTLYRVYCESDATALCLTISEEFLRLAGWGADTAIFYHIPNAQTKDTIDFEMRRRYADLFKSFFQEADTGIAAGQAIALAAWIREQFAGRQVTGAAKRSETLVRFESILRNMQQQWREPLSLSSVAAKAFLTPNYLSRLFRQQLGMTFTDYLVSLRLEHAALSLQETKDAVTQIAYESGFKNVNSFISYFSRCYGQTPGQYRKTQQEAQIFTPSEQVADWIQELVQYADDKLNYGRQAPTEVRRGTVSVITPGVPLRHTWRKLVNIGYARDGLIGVVQEQLRRAQKEIGFTYLRFHGIFDEDMHIYQQNQDGSTWFNFAYADMLFDFILSIGLTPFVELSFMPEPLARDSYQLFDRKSINSMYTDQSKWEALVQASVAHWIERYGLATVINWKWTVISINYVLFHEIPISYEDYWNIYKTAYRTLKTLDSRLQIGGPGGFAYAVLHDGTLERFLQDTAAEECVPDFLTAQCYPHENIFEDTEFLHFTASQSATPSILSKDAEFTEHFLRDFRALAKLNGLEDREIVLEEWAATLWQRDLSGDTCYKACWLFKNVLENYDQADMLGYWLLTDFIEEWVALGGVFHGGYGLFTASGIPKAGYHAMHLLRQIGTERIAAGPGWFVSRDAFGIQIFLYHYCHYDGLYRYRYTKLRDARDAYKVFESSGSLQIELTLQDLQAGNYREEIRSINRTAGSSFDRWVAMGAPASMRPDDLRYLTDTAQPAFEIRERNVTDTLAVIAELQPHEVRVIHLQKRDC